MMSVLMDAVFISMDELGFTPNFRVRNIPVQRESDVVQTGDVTEWPASFADLLSKIQENEEKLKLKYLRMERDKKLRETDHYTLPDFPHNSDAWRTYRQKLRDLPATGEVTINPDTGAVEVVWPNK
jgi:hypothetical protein